MTLEEIVAALNALVEGADADGRDLTDEEVRKYEELEIQLASKRKTAELRARTEAYKTPVSGGLQVNTKTATARLATHGHGHAVTGPARAVRCGHAQGGHDVVGHGGHVGGDGHAPTISNSASNSPCSRT